MGSVRALVRQARAAGLHLRAERGRLVIRGPKAAEPLALALLEYKTDVLDLLTSPKLICAYFVGHQPTGRCERCSAPFEAHVWRTRGDSRPRGAS